MAKIKKFLVAQFGPYYLVGWFYENGITGHTDNVVNGSKQGVVFHCRLEFFEFQRVNMGLSSGELHPNMTVMASKWSKRVLFFILF